MDNYDTDSELPSHRNQFTPINSPRGKKAEASNATFKEEHEDEDEDDMSLSDVKAEDDTEWEPLCFTMILVLDQETGQKETTPVKTTPPKTKKGTPGSGKRKSAASGAENPKTPSKKSKKNNTDKSTPTSARATPVKLPPIPTSRATAGELDLMILRMRDDYSAPWLQINKAYAEKSGIKVGGTTLRCRYTTMKANFTGVTEEDEDRLIRFKKEVEKKVEQEKKAMEEKLEQEKWRRIADAIHADGGDRYPTATLQKKFRELSKKGAGNDDE
ncbi:hypothetical protein BDW74DRAFT_178164 [Aspergillus multicolor]|uniref:uncharacterized protein n=1 Tax=Aspergillus multicolor TaxID=41759 RepID=UPI003CCE16A1